MTASEPPVHVCRIRTAEGDKDYLTILPLDVVRAQGLAPEAIVGVLAHPLGPEECITPEIVARNRVFVDFLHEVIARHGPEQPGCRAEAKRLGNGWVWIIDQRTPTPAGPVPPEDIIGGFEVKDGDVVAGSYRRNPRHMVFSTNGFFRLDAGLQECLLRELIARNPQRSSS